MTQQQVYKQQRPQQLDCLQHYAAALKSLSVLDVHARNQNIVCRSCELCVYAVEVF